MLQQCSISLCPLNPAFHAGTAAAIWRHVEADSPCGKKNHFAKRAAATEAEQHGLFCCRWWCVAEAYQNGELQELLERLKNE
jgi:hypothetical protein